MRISAERLSIGLQEKKEWLGLLKLKDPGAGLKSIALMELGIVRGSIDPHFVDDFEPAKFSACGAVIHNLASPCCAGPPHSVMNNCDTDISAGKGKQEERHRTVPRKLPARSD